MVPCINCLCVVKTYILGVDSSVAIGYSTTSWAVKHTNISRVTQRVNYSRCWVAWSESNSKLGSKKHKIRYLPKIIMVLSQPLNPVHWLSAIRFRQPSTQNLEGLSLNKHIICLSRPRKVRTSLTSQNLKRRSLSQRRLCETRTTVIVMTLPSIRKGKDSWIIRVRMVW